MTKVKATITIELDTPENIAAMTPQIRGEFTRAIGEAYGTLEAAQKFNSKNGARTIIRSVVGAELWNAEPCGYALIQVTGGVADIGIAEGCEVDILDYDNLKEQLADEEREPTEDGLILSDRELAYIREHDAEDLWPRVEALQNRCGDCLQVQSKCQCVKGLQHQ